VKVLDAFVTYEPTRITKVTYEANINHKLLKEIITEFLMNGLLEERKIKNKVLYVATPKAKLTIEQFKEVIQLFPRLEEFQSE
jgi:predicted transcriptional regulator